MKKNIVILDLDGTTCDDSHRAHYLSGPNKDYDKYHSLCADDPPIKPMIMFVRAALTTLTPTIELELWAVTGRDEMRRGLTMDWLRRMGVFADVVLMRPKGNYDPAPQMKIELVEDALKAHNRAGHMREHILVVIDDREDVCDAFRERGILALQTGPIMELKSNG